MPRERPAWKCAGEVCRRASGAGLERRIRIWELEALEKSYNAKARVYWQRSPRVLITLHFAQGLASDRPLGLVMQENSLNNPIQDAIVRQHEGDGSRRKLR